MPASCRFVLNLRLLGMESVTKIRQDILEAATSQPWVFMILAAGSHALCSQQFNYLPGYLQHRSSSNHQTRHFDNARVIGLFFLVIFYFSSPTSSTPLFCWEMQSHCSAGLASRHLAAPLKPHTSHWRNSVSCSPGGRQCFYGNSSQRFSLCAAAAAYCMTSFVHCNSLSRLWRKGSSFLPKGKKH